MSDRNLRIAARFRGPKASGNGGYTAGLFARKVAPGEIYLSSAEAAALQVTASQAPSPSGAVRVASVPALEVTLRRPPPLERDLLLDESAFGGEGKARLLDGDVVLAELARVRVELTLPPAPTFEQAETWSQHYVGHVHHEFPECFSCGPGRAPLDGLRIFPGRPGDSGLVAAMFRPDASVADAAGQVLPEVLWAALDCAGFFGASPAGGPRALLGRMAAALVSPLLVGQPAVVTGWGLGQEGRKLFAGTALHTAEGKLIGCARQVWITI